jgi:hypothetical protein
VKSHIVATAFALLILAGCAGDRTPTPTTPTAPVPPPAQPAAVVSTWTAHSLVVASDEGNACEGATRINATTKDIEWRITTEDPAILLEVDMVNYPVDHMRYSGTSSGLDFTASYATGSEYLDFFCELRGGRLTGYFSADHSRFDATETLIWGPPSEERTVTRHWTGLKR